jgi:hypothetical protein
MSSTKTDPGAVGGMLTYGTGLREQKLMMPRCDDSGSYWFPAFARR